MNMNNITICDIGWTSISEFYVSNKCNVNILWDLILRIISCCIGGIFMLGQIIILIRRQKIFRKKKMLSRVVLVMSIIQNLIMIIRPLLGILTGWRSSTNLIIEFITHISAASLTVNIIIFIYIEARLIYKSSMIKHQMFVVKHRKKILTVMSVITTMLYLIGPLITFYTSYLNHYLVFWIVIVFTKFTVVSYFCFLGVNVYLIIKQEDRFKELARHIIIAISICSIMGILTVTIGILSCTGTVSIDWILIEIYWDSDIISNTAIFSILIQHRKKNMIIDLNNLERVINNVSETGSDRNVIQTAK